MGFVSRILGAEEAHSSSGARGDLRTVEPVGAAQAEEMTLVNSSKDS
jgi:hypothetical protein